MNTDNIIPLAINYGMKLIAAVLILIIGFWLADKFMKYARKAFDKRSVDTSLSSFLTSFINILIKILVIIIAIASVGVEMTSIVAILGAASLAVGMALSGTFQNFAGGVVILFLKPFKVGDYIEAQGFAGTVKEIAMFTTLIVTPDNKSIFIPNGSLANGSVTNYTREDTRRLDLVYSVAYGNDMNKAREVLSRIIAADGRIKATPEPVIVLSALAASSVNISVRVWIASGELFAVQSDLNEKVYDTFPKEGLDFPYPRMDVQMIS